MRIRFGLLAITAGFVPAIILLHEMAHLGAGIAVGVPNPKLTMSVFTHDPAPWLSGWQVAMIALAGPAVNLVFGWMGITAGGAQYGLAARMVGVAACVRLLELFPYALAEGLRRATGVSPRGTTYDEDVAFRALGLAGDMGLILATAAFAAMLFLLLNRDRSTAPSLGIGALIGWLAWKTLLTA